MTTENPARPGTHRFVLVALVLPSLVTAIAVGIQLWALPDVPATVATHWGENGLPDGFAPAWISPLLTVLLGLGLPLLLALMALPSLRRGDHGASYRLLGAIALAMSVLMGVLGTWTLVMQRGIADAADAPAVWMPLLAAFTGAIGAGILGWFLQPAEPWRASPPAPAAPLPLESGERAVWLQSTSIAGAAVIVLSLTTLLTAALTVVTAVVAAGPVVWISGAVTVLIAVLIATTATFHVRVDDTGLTVTSVAGLPRFHVPAADIASAAAVQVQPMGEFGGWGVRYAPGRLGVVLRAGDAIEATRRDGRRFVVTADDAATGARLLETVAQRAAGADAR